MDGGFFFAKYFHDFLHLIFHIFAILIVKILK